MKSLLVILTFAVLCSAQTIELSALNYGGDWQAADVATIKQIKDQMDGKGIVDSLTILYHYKYTVSDSAISITDMSYRYPKVLERWVEYNPVDECPVELIYVKIVKRSPAKDTYSVFSTWNGGPYKSGIRPLKDDQKIEALLKFNKKKGKVNSLLTKDKNKDWKVKGKKLNDKEKRNVAWKLVNNRLKGSEIEKTNKVK